MRNSKNLNRIKAVLAENRIKAVLADAGQTNKWLAEQLGKDPVPSVSGVRIPRNRTCRR